MTNEKRRQQLAACYRLLFLRRLVGADENSTAGQEDRDGDTQPVTGDVPAGESEGERLDG